MSIESTGRLYTFMMRHLEIGKRGERLAEDHLRKKDYKIYDRNVRLGRDEIDIIAYDPVARMVVFVEVKTRSRYDSDFLPTLAITPRKKRALKRSAWKWMHDKQYEEPWRVDCILVIKSKIYRHLKYV